MVVWGSARERTFRAPADEAITASPTPSLQVAMQRRDVTRGLERTEDALTAAEEARLKAEGEVRVGQGKGGGSTRR